MRFGKADTAAKPILARILRAHGVAGMTWPMPYQRSQRRERLKKTRRFVAIVRPRGRKTGRIRLFLLSN
jgi:hypothetical protein